MRRRLIVIGLGLVSAAAAAQVPSLQVFGAGDLQPGLYSVSAAGGGGETVNKCVVSPETLLHAGLEGTDGRSCAHTVIEDTPDRGPSLIRAAASAAAVRR